MLEDSNKRIRRASTQTKQMKLFIDQINISDVASLAVSASVFVYVMRRAIKSKAADSSGSSSTEVGPLASLQSRLPVES